MGPLSEACILHIVRQVLLALSYLHANGIIHRDIKAANILLNERAEVKLGDFGVASQVMNTFRRTSFVGSPYWMAPEVIKRSQYDSKADIWSLGITIYELVRGEPPLAHVEPARAICVIPTCPPPRLDSSYGEALRELVAACLHDDPNKRPSADELLRGKILRKSLTAITKSPLDSLVAQYRSIRRNNPTQGTTDDAGSLVGVDNGDGGTIKSSWTFGTYHSSDDEGQDGEAVKDKGEDEDEETRSDGISYQDEASGAESDPFGGSIKQLADSLIYLEPFANTAAPNAVVERERIALPRSMTPSSASLSITTGASGAGLSRSRSLSAQSLGGFSATDSFSDSTSRLLTLSPHHRRAKSGSSGASSGSLDLLSSNAVTRRAPSLLNFPPLCDANDPIQQLRERETKDRQRIEEKLDIFTWSHPASIRDHELPRIYQLMTRLKQTLLDIPALTDTRDECGTIWERIVEHSEYSERCLVLVSEASELINRLTSEEE